MNTLNPDAVRLVARHYLPKITFPEPVHGQTHWKVYGDNASNRTLLGKDWIAQTAPPILIGKYSLEGELIKEEANEPS